MGFYRSVFCVVYVHDARALLFSTMNRFVSNPFAEIAMCKLFHTYAIWRIDTSTFRCVFCCLTLCVQVKSISSICLSFNSTQKSSIWYYLISFHPHFFHLLFASFQGATEENLICLYICVLISLADWMNEYLVVFRIQWKMKIRKPEQSKQIGNSRNGCAMCMCIALLLLHLLRQAAKVKHTSFEFWTNKSESLWIRIKFHGRAILLQWRARCRSVCGRWAKSKS